MDTSRIRDAANSIDRRKSALKWLENYGAQLTGRDDGQANVDVKLYFAGSCEGSAEAKELLSSYARVALPEIVQSALACCRNDIEIHTDTIRRELSQEPAK